MENLTQIIKDIDFKFHDYNINTYQNDENVAIALNKFFGLTSGVKRYDYGVKVHLMGNYIAVTYCNGRSAKYAPIEYHVDINCNIQYKSNDKNVYLKPTQEQIDAVLNFCDSLIEEREQEIERAKSNPSIEDFIDLCFKESLEVLKDNTKYEPKKSVGSSQSMGNRTTNAIVISDKNNQSIYGQVGYITIRKNEFGEFKCSVKSIGCGGYGEFTLTMDNYKEKIKSAVKWLC